MASDVHRTGLRRGVGKVLRHLGLRPEPLCWDPPRPDESVSEVDRPSPVDIVLPVYGAHDDLQTCLDAVARHTDLRTHRLVVVVDGDPEWRADWLDPLRELQPAADVLVLKNETNRGFVHSANRGMAASDHDVVLLNSDAVVTAGWLERLQDAAASRADVATVTPFSNHATLCSLPEPWVANELPSGYDVERFGELVTRVSAREYPCLPTGVGFCLFVRRRALEAVGPFDETSFGAGYGEETDFCLRCLAAGFVHLLDDATFVYHRGEASFGEARSARVDAAEIRLAARHPAYVATIAAYMAADPLWAARRRVRWGLRREARRTTAEAARRVLHVVHGWPPYNHAGTEFYAHTLARHQSARREVAVYTRIADPAREFGAAEEIEDEGLRVRLVVNNFLQRSPLSRNALRSSTLERDFAGFLGDFAPDLVHVHHLAGHALSLPSVVAARGIPLIYQVQDWWALCARANLAHRDGGLCPGPSPSRCARCLPMTGLPGAAVLNPVLYRLRRRLAQRALSPAAAYVMGSQAIYRDYLDAGLLRTGDRAYVLPYGVELPTSEDPDRGVAALPLRFGYVGSIQPHKGVHIAVEAFRDVDPSAARLDIWGDPAIDAGYAERLRSLATPGVEFRGRFEEDAKSRVFADMDVLLLPSIGLESFGLVAREALAHGVPVIASRRGALEELFPSEGRGGSWIEPGDVVGLRRRIQELVAAPEQIATWRLHGPGVVSTAEHAEMIEQVYLDVLGAAS